MRALAAAVTPIMKLLVVSALSVFWDRFVGLIKPSFADVAAKEQDQRSFFLRMYGKLFVLTACVAQNVPSKTGRCRIPHAHSGRRSHAKQGGMLFTSDTSEVEIWALSLREGSLTPRI